MKINWQKAEKILENNGITVIPTDTLYGILGRALSKKTVERIYAVKGRERGKPFIVLISSYDDLKKFGVKIDKEKKKYLEKIWPGKVSVILPCPSKRFEYLHRGKNSIAFRMVGRKNKNLFDLLDKVGPLVAPSANPAGKKPAHTIKEAKKYFYPVRNREGSQREPISNGVGKKIDLYVNGGRKKSLPSTLVKLENNDCIVLRQGQKKIKSSL